MGSGVGGWVRGRRQLGGGGYSFSGYSTIYREHLSWARTPALQTQVEVRGKRGTEMVPATGESLPIVARLATLQVPGRTAPRVTPG